MKKQFRTAMLSTACMLIVAVMSLTGVTYAWFTSGTKANVSGMDVTVATATGGILVSETGTGDWKQTLALENAKKSGINPLSTFGAVDFFTASFSEVDNSKLITTKAEETDLTDNYIVQELYLMTDSPSNIKITLDGTYFYDVKNGEVAATRIGQAARMAIFEVTETGSVLKGIIAPYDATGVGNSIVSDTSAYIGVKGETPEEGENYKVADGTYFDNVTLVAPSAIQFTLEGTETEGGATPTHIKVVIWLEGQDAECSNPNAGGAFNTYLNFDRVAE